MRKLLIILSVLALLLAACGGDDDDAQPTTEPPTEEPTEEPAAECVDLTADPVFAVVMTDNQFTPTCLIVSRDQGLTLQNAGSNTHSFSLAGTDVSIDVEAGTEQNLEPIGGAIEAGTYVMYCRFHGSEDGSGMAGELQAA
jgi:plastocyanin